MNAGKIKHEWHTLHCSDCNDTIIYSPKPLNCYQPVYCYKCAETLAEIANVMMPVGSSMNTHQLYRISSAKTASKNRMNFLRLWDTLYARLEKHRVAKVDTRLSANKNSC